MRGLYVETLIRADVARVWELSQEPTQHVRWDLRFTSIEPMGTDVDGHPAFRYSLRLPGRTLTGRGVSVGEQRRPDGTGTSALRFTSDDAWSPLQDGSGYWKYVPTADGVRFLTGYDYQPGGGPLGALIDPVLTRPLVGWLTARSFEALRIWLEHDVPPETTHRRGHAELALRATAGMVVVVAARRRGPLLAVLGGLTSVIAASLLPVPDAVPRARRCLRRPPDAGSGRPPDTLRALRRIE